MKSIISIIDDTGFIEIPQEMLENAGVIDAVEITVIDGEILIVPKK